MNMIYLHTIPEWKGKLREQYEGKSLIEVLNLKEGPKAILWCVKKLSWQLDDLAKDELNVMLKQQAKGEKGHTGYFKRNNKSKHFNR